MDFKQASIDLWTIIDDIDTFSDMMKSDDIAFRKFVENKVRERFKIMISDGYNLFSPDHEQVTNDT